MDFIKNWTFCICITLILSVIFSVLAPKGTMGRFYKVIISVFIFISFLYPLTDFKISDFNINFNFEKEYTNVVESSAENEIENSIALLLEHNGIESSSVTAETSLNGDEITIDRVQVSVIDKYSVSETEKIIFDNLGIAAEVKYIGE